GAEHKAIHCIENGLELTVSNIKKQPIEHSSCMTGFMLYVILLGIVLFLLLPSGNLMWRIVTRLILLPLIAGIAYEINELLNRSNHKVITLIKKPGLWLQRLIVKEPEDAMLEVAIASV